MGAHRCYQAPGCSATANVAHRAGAITIRIAAALHARQLDVQPPPSRSRPIARTRSAAVPPAAAAERAESSDSACSSNVSEPGFPG